MSIELIAVLVAIAAVLITALIEVLYLGGILREMRTKMGADDAALYLQGRRIEEVLRLMRDADAAR